MAATGGSWEELGPPSQPIGFDRPRMFRGVRSQVVVFNRSTGEHEVVNDVLLRDYERSGDPPQWAYHKMPFKEPIQTIMGHVEMCRVLERCHHEQDDEDDESDSVDHHEDDFIFQWTDRRVAVKVNYADRMDQLRGRHAENPLQEIAAMQLLGKDPVHVLGALEVLFDGQNLNVVMQFCDGGDLFQLLQDSQNRPNLPPGTPGLTEDEARYWFRQIMTGVDFLHNRGICHRDLSPENVMINNGREGLIIDMGMCLRVPYPNPNGDGVVSIVQSNGAMRCKITPQGPCGKLPYMSPEVYANRRPFDGAAADVWTCGTILFCMITGNRSYQRPHMSDPQFYWMSQGLRQLLKDWHVNLSEDGTKLLEGMLQVSVQKRLTIDQVRSHPWFDLADAVMDEST